MKLSTKLSILSKKLEVRYKVSSDNIKIKSDKDERMNPFIIEVDILGQGRGTQLSPSEMDSINKKLNFKNTAIIINRIDKDGHCLWQMATYFDE